MRHTPLLIIFAATALIVAACAGPQGAPDAALVPRVADFAVSSGEPLIATSADAGSGQAPAEDDPGLEGAIQGLWAFDVEASIHLWATSPEEAALARALWSSTKSTIKFDAVGATQMATEAYGAERVHRGSYRVLEVGENSLGLELTGEDDTGAIVVEPATFVFQPDGSAILTRGGQSPVVLTRAARTPPITLQPARPAPRAASVRGHRRGAPAQRGDRTAPGACGGRRRRSRRRGAP